MSLWYWSCANQTSWFRPWHATRNVVSLVATENRPDFPRTDPPRAHLQLNSWFHTFVDLATHILTTRITAKGVKLCRRNSWRHFANSDQKTCIQMCVCIYIYIYIYSLCTVYNIYISEIPIKGWLLSFVLLSWHARLILYSTVGITDNDTQEKWINVSQTMAGTE